jgi:hypothetical protein
VTINTLPYINIPETDQINYIGCYSAVYNVAAFLGTELGTLFITFTTGFQWRVFGIVLGNKQLLMIFTASIMFFSTQWIYQTNRQEKNQFE